MAQDNGRTDMGQADGQKGRRMAAAAVGGSNRAVRGRGGAICRTDTLSQGGGRRVILPNDGEKY